MNKEIIDIRKRINDVSLDTTLQRLLRVAREGYMGKALQELEAVNSTYRYLKQYLLTGYNDSKRESLYHDLKLRVYGTSTEMLRGSLEENNRSFAQASDSARKNQVSIDEIENDIALHEGDIYTYRQHLFNTLYTTLTLSVAQEKALRDFLLSPSRSMADVRVVISALMLSSQLLFDIHKFSLLTEVCLATTNPDLRQMALIAIVFAQPSLTEMTLYGEEISSFMERMVSVENIRQELVETQLQVLLSADTKDTQKTINEEIMPILKTHAVNVEFKEKTEEDLLDEILHPDKEEKEMEEVEKSVDRIRQMRDDGADVFFAGFSQTKRFSFFYTLVNWFLPFSMDHPQVAQLSTGEISSDAIVRLMDMQNFCDSDKYSFYFTFANVVKQLPPQLLEMLKKGEVTSELGDDVKQDTAYRRRLYLQDLYRFYTLYTSRVDFINPFANEKTLVFFTWEPIQKLFMGNDYLLRIARQLLKRGFFAQLDKLLEGSFDERNGSYLKLKALSQERQQHYQEAMEYFHRALTLEPNNGVLMRKMAETAQKLPDYDMARQLYEKCIELMADEDSSQLEYEYALCCLRTKDTKAGISTLYKLYYIDPESIVYREALAWGLLKSDKYEEALNMYSSLKEEEMSRESNVRRALALWQSHNRAEAIAVLRSLALRLMLSPREITALLVKENEVCNMKISHVDLYVVTDLTFDNSL